MSKLKRKRCGADESRIDGFCSIECRDAFDYEEEIAELQDANTELHSRIAELEAERKRLPEVYDETKWKENLIRVRELFADRFGDVDVEQFFQKTRSESYPGSTKGE